LWRFWGGGGPTRRQPGGPDPLPSPLRPHPPQNLTLSPLVPPPLPRPQVKTIIVCGHYNCGAVKAALTMPASNPGKLNVVNCWIADIREARNQVGRR
jgi:hypothetical protein